MGLSCLHMSSKMFPISALVRRIGSAKRLGKLQIYIGTGTFRANKRLEGSHWSAANALGYNCPVIAYAVLPMKRVFTQRTEPEHFMSEGGGYDWDSLDVLFQNRHDPATRPNEP
jgi:hypothetical protein